VEGQTRLLNPEDGVTKILRNIGICLAVNKA